MIGDVTGHVVAAAPIMAQIRHMLRALVFDHGGPPSLVVSKLDRALPMFAEPPTATLVLTQLERVAEAYLLRWSNSGTPPPLLLHLGLGARFLSPVRHGNPVGVDPTVPRYDHAQRLPARSTPPRWSGCVPSSSRGAASCSTTMSPCSPCACRTTGRGEAPGGPVLRERWARQNFGSGDWALTSSAASASDSTDGGEPSSGLFAVSFMARTATTPTAAAPTA